MTFALKLRLSQVQRLLRGTFCLAALFAMGVLLVHPIVHFGESDEHPDCAVCQVAASIDAPQMPLAVILLPPPPVVWIIEPTSEATPQGAAHHELRIPRGPPAFFSI